MCGVDYPDQTAVWHAAFHCWSVTRKHCRPVQYRGPKRPDRPFAPELPLHPHWDSAKWSNSTLPLVPPPCPAAQFICDVMMWGRGHARVHEHGQSEAVVCQLPLSVSVRQSPLIRRRQWPLWKRESSGLCRWGEMGGKWRWAAEGEGAHSSLSGPLQQLAIHPRTAASGKPFASLVS